MADDAAPVDEAIYVPAVRNEHLFDLRPAQIGGFALKGRSATPSVSRPSLNGWIQAMQFAVGAHEASPYWICDLMAYAETRESWRTKLDQAVSLTGYKEHTLHNLGYIGRRVEEPERQLAPSIGHAAAVAPLDREQQTVVLTKARDNHWTVSQTRTAATATKRRKVIDGQARLEGQYPVIVVEPRWPTHERGKTIKALCQMPMPAHASPNAALFLWIPNSMLLVSPGPVDVITAWDFEYRATVIWHQVIGTPSRFLSLTHETLALCTRGTAFPATAEESSVQTIRRSFTSHEKPVELLALIERMYPTGPYLHIGAGPVRPGWSNWSLEFQECASARATA